MNAGNAASRPFVSVIVPVLNDPAGIRMCVGALLGQSYPATAYEIIVADNGSTDGTRTAVQGLRKAAGERLRLIMEDRVRSSYAARNRALDEARGTVLAFTDADCVPMATWIEHGVRALQDQGDGCVAGRIVFTYNRDPPNLFEYWDSAVHLNQRYYAEQLGFGATANLLAYAAVFGRVGQFRSDLISGGDHEFGHRLQKAGERLSYVADAVVTHPARATLRATVRKSLRLALAHQRLHELGVFESRRNCFRRLRPILRCPSPRDWNGHLAPLSQVAVMLVHNLNAWMTSAICLAQGCLPGKPASQPPRLV
jgi:glycosyltransferase involved in cell wall biosynthesis